MACFWCCAPCRHWDKKRAGTVIEKSERNKLDVKLSIKLDGDKLIEFVKDNLMVFLNEDNRIGYVCLNNKDRLENPGKVITEFKYIHKQNGGKYIVRLLEYHDKGFERYLKLTVNKNEDSTDCSSITWGNHQAN